MAVQYQNWANFEEDKKFFSQQSNLLMFCRNKKNLKFLSKNFIGCKVEFIPDFSYYLTPPLVSEERKGTLYVLRCDNESIMPSTLCDIVEKLSLFLRLIGFALKKNLHGLAYENALRITCGVEFSNYRRLKGDDILCDLQTATYDITDDNREQVISDVLKYYGSFRQVVTDRFHAGIFAKLMNTPVKMLPSLIKEKKVVNFTDLSSYFHTFREIVEEFDKSRSGRMKTKLEK